VKRRQRVAAYVVVGPAADVLLARWTGPRGPEWTLPGGGLDFGEDPADAAVREVREETGYTVRLDRLLFVNSFRRVLPDAPIDFHAIQIVYAGTVIGGDLCHEVDGSTDMAAWYPRAEVAALTRVPLVDLGLTAAGLS
jgi:ADP-ribose pyrophosphatase YjhB (NUDIX family)